jgi:hypothetical protein
VLVQVKALACELPYEAGIPLSRFSCREIAAEAVRRGIVAQVSGATVWRWLDEDAIKPWQHRSWIYPRDPEFEEKAGRVLDLYQGTWGGEALGSDEYVICSDEKTSIQARVRIHPTQPVQGHQSMRVEHEYERGGALAYMAAWDVKGAKVFGRCEKKSGIAAFERLVADVMSREPYRSARRVFWVVDNGSSHRGVPSIKRMKSGWPNAELVHLPVHASWLNQMEIYFGIVHRKVLTPNDFVSLEGVAQRLKEFERHYERVAKPFEWKFTREDMSRMLRKLREDAEQRALAA